MENIYEEKGTTTKSQQAFT